MKTSKYDVHFTRITKFMLPGFAQVQNSSVVTVETVSIFVHHFHCLASKCQIFRSSIFSNEMIWCICFLIQGCNKKSNRKVYSQFCHFNRLLVWFLRYSSYSKHLCVLLIISISFICSHPLTSKSPWAQFYCILCVCALISKHFLHFVLNGIIIFINLILLENVKL